MGTGPLKTPHQKGAPRDISALAGIQQHAARIIIYAKGFNCTELQRHPEVAEVATCYSTPNYGGREAHTMIHHVVHNYRRLAHFTMFLQDDYTPNKNDIINEWIDDKTRHNATLTQPHSEEGCVCYVVREHGFAPRTYGYYAGIQNLLRTYFNTSHDGTDIAWPRSSQLMVARSRILKHPHETYKRFLDSGVLLNEDHFANDGMNCGVPFEEVADLRALGNACPHSLGWAHDLERAWFPYMVAEHIHPRQ